MCECVCVHVHTHPLSHARLFATLWTVARQAPLFHWTLQARILEWVTISFSRGSSQPRDQTHISCISCIRKWVLYQLSHLLLERISTSESVCISHSCVQLFATPGTVAGR